MEMNKIERLFIAEYEYAKYWTGGKRNILSSIKDGDFYLIFKTGKAFAPSPMFQQIMSDMDIHKEIYEVEELGESDYEIFVKSKIDKFSNENTNVYFLYMETMFDILKDKLTNVANVQSCKNFRVGRASSKKKTVMGQIKEQMKESKKEEKSDNSEIFSGLNEVITIDDVSVHTNNNFTPIPPDEMDNIEPPKQEKKLDIDKKPIVDEPSIKKENKENIVEDIEELVGKEEKEEDKSNTFISVEDMLNDTPSESRSENKDSQKKEPTSKINQPPKPSPNVNRNNPNNQENSGRIIGSEKPKLNLEKDLSKVGVNVNKDGQGKEKEKKKIESSIDYASISDMFFGDDDSKSRQTKSPENTRNMGQKIDESGSTRPTRLSSSSVQGSAPPSRPPKPQRGGPQFGQKRPMGSGTPSSDNITIQELEKQIFGGKQATTIFDKTYTDLDDEKARLTNNLMERLINNINKFAKKVLDYNFNRAKYVELVTTLVKSIDYNDFLDSWDIMEPGYPLLIEEKIYTTLRDEAKYYAKVCETLYEYDNW